MNGDFGQYEIKYGHNLSSQLPFLKKKKATKNAQTWDTVVSRDKISDNKGSLHVLSK